MAEFNAEKNYLGDPCRKYGHTYKDTGKALRYKSNSTCIECKEKRTNNKIEKKKDLIRSLEIKHKIDTDKRCLGRLCKRSHDYKNTGFSLRRKKPRACIECYREYIRKTIDHRREKHKEWVLKNPEAAKKYRRTHYRKNVKGYIENSKKWAKTPKGRENRRKHDRKQSRVLSDRYIKRMLRNTHGFKTQEATDELIELKREQLKMFRINKKFKKEVQDGSIRARN